MIQRLSRRWFAFGLGLAAGALLFFGGAALFSAFSWLDEPALFRVYRWDSGYHFLMALAAVILLGIGRMLLRRRRESRANSEHAEKPESFASSRAVAPNVPRIFEGLALAALVVSLSGFGIARAAPVAWDLPAAAAEATDAEWPPALDARARRIAQKENRPVLYYFRADWCPSCPDFERYVLGSPELQAELAPFVKVRVTVNDFDRWHSYLDKAFGVYAIPSVALRDRRGRVLERTLLGADVSLKAARALLRAAATPAQ